MTESLSTGIPDQPGHEPERELTEKEKQDILFRIADEFYKKTGQTQPTNYTNDPSLNAWLVGGSNKPFPCTLFHPHGPNLNPDVEFREEASGPIGNLHRRVISVFAREYLWNEIKFHAKEMTRREVWAYAVSRWRHLVNSAASSAADEAKHRVNRFVTCIPPGFLYEKVTPACKARPAYCGLVECLFCFARKVGFLFTDLAEARRKLPDGATLYAAVYRNARGNEKSMVEFVRSCKLAGGVGMKIRSTSGKTYSHSGVVVTDVKTRLTYNGLKATEIKDDFKFADLLVASCRYPWRAWLKGRGRVVAVRGLLSTKRGEKVFASHGVCRNDYVPGKSFLDFAGSEQKPM